MAMDQQNGFRGKLLPGERIVWAGQPMSGLMFTARDLFLVPFSVVWCGFAIVWTTGVALSGGGAFALFGLIFVAVGLGISVGRFLVDAWLRRSTRYALTNRRVLILRTAPTADFVALSLGRLPQARLTERKDGRGTIRFGPQANLFNFGGTGLSVWVPSLDPTPQFLGIPDAAKVFDLVQGSENSGV
jgi:hypothetical protein